MILGISLEYNVDKILTKSIANTLTLKLQSSKGLSTLEHPCPLKS